MSSSLNVTNFMSLKKRLKQKSIFISLYHILHTFPLFFRFRLIQFLKLWWSFLKGYRSFSSQRANSQFEKLSWQPYLLDKTLLAPLDPIYFYQKTWLVKKTFTCRPIHHYNIDSKATNLAFILQYMPTTVISIRPVSFTPNNLFLEKTLS